MTIAEALNVSDRSVSFREAEILLAHALEKPREYLHSYPELELSAEQSERYEQFLQAREANLPVAYITDQKEFYGRVFSCDKRALIPRPETEGLIEQALTLHPGRILELGTGCGNIAITLSLELATPVLATDISTDALALAQSNQARLGGEITFVQADLFDHPTIRQQAPFALIIANLPYVPSTWQTDPEAQPEVVFHEPAISLFGGIDGLDIYRRFLAEVDQYLTPDGDILIEFNEDQTTKLQQLIREKLPDYVATVSQDYAGLDRTLHLRRQAVPLAEPV